MKIRRETEKDFGENYDLVKVAFQTANVSDGKEQDFVVQLRSGETYVPELALVADQSFRLAGEMGYTAVSLVGDPATYHRFGFRSVAEWGITYIHEIPVEYVMACERVPNGLEGLRGKVDCS